LTTDNKPGIERVQAFAGQWLKKGERGRTPFLGPKKLLAGVPRPHTAANGTSRLTGDLFSLQ